MTLCLNVRKNRNNYGLNLKHMVLSGFLCIINNNIYSLYSQNINKTRVNSFGSICG